MRDLTKFLIKAFIRKGLAIIGGVLLTYGVISSEEAGGFVSLYLEEAVGSLLIGASYVWEYVYQNYVKDKVVAAKVLPPSTTSEELERAVEQGVGSKN